MQSKWSIKFIFVNCLEKEAINRRLRHISSKYKMQKNVAVKLHFTNPHLLSDLEVIRGTAVSRDNRSALQGQCNKLLARCSSGGWQEALYLYEVMADIGLNLDRHTFYAMITSCKNARPSQVEVAIEVFKEMQRSGFPADTASYNLTIGACEKDGQWRRALKLFKDMVKQKIVPNTATYSVISETCAKAKLDDIPDLYDAMKFAGVPEFIAYSTGARATAKKHSPNSLHAA